MSKKPRLDEILVARGFFSTLHEASAAVLAGEVVVGEHRETSAGRRLDPDVPIRVKSRKKKAETRFVSRGGEKLAAALEAFAFDPSGLNCADLGCSTGGFTDCLLQAGARRVSAIDVGYGDFAWSLRNDSRVGLYERTNVRGLDPLAVEGPFDLAVADLSFISLKTVLPDVAGLINPDASFISLIKPQFEVAKSEVGEHGIVDSPEAQVRCIERVCMAAEELGFAVCGLTPSPIKGRKGNIEFLTWFKQGGESASGQSTIDSIFIEHVVEEAHDQLGG